LETRSIFSKINFFNKSSNKKTLRFKIDCLSFKSSQSIYLILISWQYLLMFRSLRVYHIERRSSFHTQKYFFPFTQDINVVVVIFVFFFVLVIKNDLFFSLLDRRLENFIRPLMFATPVVFLCLVLEIMIADIRITIWDANVYSFVFENSRYLSQHFFWILFGICSTLNDLIYTKTESRSPLSMTQSNV